MSFMIAQVTGPEGKVMVMVRKENRLERVK